MKRILVTGVNGFIGNSLKKFIEEKFPFYKVYGIDISLEKSTGRHYKSDINNRKLLGSIIRKGTPHYIFHLAGLTTTESFSKLVSDNVLTTYRLLDLVKSLSNFKTRIIIPGSSAEYGEVSRKNMPLKETQPLKPVNFYGLSKMYQTLLALSYCKGGLDIVIGRIFNIIGRGTPRSFSTGKFAYEISLIEKGRKKAVIETKDLNSRRDFLDIEDVCSGLMAIAESGKSGDVYNVCSGRSYKIKDLLNSLLKLSNCRKVKIKPHCSGASEINNISGSHKKINRDTGWKPKVTILESLKNTLDYYRKL